VFPFRDTSPTRVSSRLIGSPVESSHMTTASAVKFSVTVHVRLYMLPATGSPSVVIVTVGGGGTSAEGM